MDRQDRIRLVTHGLVGDAHRRAYTHHDAFRRLVDSIAETMVVAVDGIAEAAAPYAPRVDEWGDLEQQMADNTAAMLDRLDAEEADSG